MKTAQKIFDQNLRRQIHVGRFSKKTAKELVSLLKKSEKDILNQLALGGTSFSRKKLNATLREIRLINTKAFDKIGAKLDGTLKDFTRDEIGFNAKSLKKAYAIGIDFKKPAVNQIFAAVTAKPFEGNVLKEWIKTLDTKISNKIKSAVRMGFVEGESIPKIVNRVKTLFPGDRRGLTALVRTSINHTATIARESVYEANSEMFKGVQWVSTLDGRTTPICQSLDGKKFRLGKGKRPPAHWGCRSTTVPIVKSWKELGFDDLNEEDKLSKRPFVSDKRRVKDIPPKDRNIGITSSDEKYPQWLKRQSPKFQDDVLGKERGKLFRNGEVTIDRFSDDTGKLYTLDELQKREDI